MEFHFFDLDEAEKTGMTVLHDWVKQYSFQKEEDTHPFASSSNRSVTIDVWSASGYEPKTNKTYGGMFAYSEVVSESTGEIFYKQFFGETSEDDALRWSLDKANFILL